MTVTNKIIDPIEPGSTPGGLIRSARPLPADSGDWSGGVSALPNCGVTSTWSCDFAGAVKDVPETQDPYEFDPFIVYAGVACSGRPLSSELESLARARLERAQSRDLALQLQGSAYGNPDLDSSAVDVTDGGGAVSVRRSIAALVEAVGECNGGDVVVHAPSIALGDIMDIELARYEDGRYFIGHVPLIVDEYANDAGAGEVRLYASGPVEFALGDVQVVQNFDNEQNEDVVLAERMAILRFDPCCVFSIDATLG